PFTGTNAEVLGNTPLLIVQDLLTSPVSARASHVLPSAAWSEKSGTFVNHAGLAQTINRATNPPGEARSEGQVFWDLLGKRGLYRAADIRKDLKAIAAFADLPDEVAPQGTRLSLPLANGVAHS